MEKIFSSEYASTFYQFAEKSKYEFTKPSGLLKPAPFVQNDLFDILFDHPSFKLGNNSSFQDTLDRSNLSEPQVGYISPLSKIYFVHNGDFLDYQGSLSQVLDELYLATSDPSELISMIRLALHPARVIRSAINFKTQNSKSNPAHDLLFQSIHLGLEVYKNPSKSGDQINNFRSLAYEIGGEALINSGIKQLPDFRSWDATNPVNQKQLQEG